MSMRFNGTFMMFASIEKNSTTLSIYASKSGNGDAYNTTVLLLVRSNCSKKVGVGYRE